MALRASRSVRRRTHRSTGRAQDKPRTPLRLETDAETREASEGKAVCLDQARR
jgi:hypothetical protein